MIIYRKEPYHLQMRNIVLLDDIESGGFVYVNKDTYDQALLLSGRMDGNPQRVLDVLRSPKNEIYRTRLGFKGLMENMMKTMPKPLNMLAPFLLLCVGNQGIDWKEDDRIFAYGVLHQLSQLIDFNSVTTVPAQIRADVALPTALLMQYEVSWNELCSSLEDRIVSITPADEDDGISKFDSMLNILSSVQEMLIKLDAKMGNQTPVIIQQPTQSLQPTPVTTPAVQPVVESAVVKEAPKQEPVVEQTPVKDEPKQETKVETEPTNTATTSEVAVNAEESEDEKKAKAVAAIIAKMNAEHDSKKKEKEDKLSQLGSTSSDKENDTTVHYHTDHRYNEQERQEINNVLDEYDF